MKQALVLYGATEAGMAHFSGDLFYRTRFKIPDPTPFIEIEGKTYLLVSPLEIGRAAKEARVDEVIPFEDYLSRSEPRLTTKEGMAAFLKEKGITHVLVPQPFPYEIAKFLERDFMVEIRKAPFYPERAKKLDWEIAEIEKAQRAVERAVRKAMDFLVECCIDAESRVFRDLNFGGREFVGSGKLRDLIDQELYRQGYLAIGTIVASGVQAADPHSSGSGPIIPYSAIVMDVFPFSMKTHYFTDMTRTIFKGRPSPQLESMYNMVLEAQLLALEMIRAGVEGFSIWDKVSTLFGGRAYPASTDPMEGFFHGVGHGVGLELHEMPVIGRRECILEEGNVVTVEPGLYYSRARAHIPAGGIRIEDLVVVEEDGVRNLTRFPKSFKEMVIP